jgi:hypothetical protein
MPAAWIDELMDLVQVFEDKSWHRAVARGLAGVSR